MHLVSKTTIFTHPPGGFIDAIDAYTTVGLLRELAERGGSGLLADFARKRVVLQRAGDLLKALRANLNLSITMIRSLNAGSLLYK